MKNLQDYCCCYYGGRNNVDLKLMIHQMMVLVFAENFHL